MSRAGGSLDSRTGWTLSFLRGMRGKHPGWGPVGVLTELEKKMLAKASDGELFDPGDGPTNMAEVKARKDERTVRAAVLRYLLIDKTWPVDERGVWLRGVSIKGHLDLG